MVHRLRGSIAEKQVEILESAMKKFCWTYRIAPKFSWHSIFVNFVTSLLITKFFLVKI